MIFGLALLVILALLAAGSYPRWSHSNGWGYAPAGTFGFLLVVVVVLLLVGRL